MREYEDLPANRRDLESNLRAFMALPNLRGLTSEFAAKRRVGQTVETLARGPFGFDELTEDIAHMARIQPGVVGRLGPTPFGMMGLTPFGMMGLTPFGLLGRSFGNLRRRWNNRSRRFGGGQLRHGRRWIHTIGRSFWHLTKPKGVLPKHTAFDLELHADPMLFVHVEASA